MHNDSLNNRIELNKETNEPLKNSFLQIMNTYAYQYTYQPDHSIRNRYTVEELIEDREKEENNEALQYMSCGRKVIKNKDGTIKKISFIKNH